MSNPALNLLEISRDRWNTAFGEVTRQYRGAHGKAEGVGQDVGDQVETEGLRLNGLSADTKDGEATIWISFGRMNHGIPSAVVVRMVPRVGDSGPVIEI